MAITLLIISFLLVATGIMFSHIETRIELKKRRERIRNRVRRKKRI